MVALVAMVGAGCTGASLPPAPTGHTPTDQPSVLPSPLERPTIVLTADLSERPTGWKLVARIPFGSAPESLGLVTDRNRTPVPYLPASFAVDEDGSIWILDVVNKRLSHHSAGGAYVGEVTGFRFDRFSPHPMDVIAAAGRLYVLEELAPLMSKITTVEGGRISGSRFVLQGQDHLLVTYLFPTAEGPGGYVEGFSDLDRLGTGPSGFHELDPRTGTISPLPGIPLPGDRWGTGRFLREQHVAIGFISRSSASDQPVTIRVVPSAGARPIKAVNNVETVLAVGAGIGMYLHIAPALRKDRHLGGGQWYLQLAADGRPLVWLRVPSGHLEDTDQHRHIAVGPDGSLYLMVPTMEEERIYLLG